MDATKILNIGCAIGLTVCLILSAIAVSNTKRAERENEYLKEEVQLLTQMLEETIVTEGKDNTPTSIPTSTPTDTAPQSGYRIQSAGEKIGVYTANGKLVRLLDVDPTTLPRIDREALENGITVDSWERALAYLNDYTG